jgi:hypothetical protein
MKQWKQFQDTILQGRSLYSEEKRGTRSKHVIRFQKEESSYKQVKGKMMYVPKSTNKIKS